MQQRDVERRGGGGLDEREETWQRGPGVEDAGAEEVGDAGVAAERLEDGQDATDLVGLQERGEVAEGGDENHAGVAWEGFRRGFGGWVGQGGGEVRGVWVREVEGCGGGHGGAEALAEEDGAG